MGYAIVGYLVKGDVAVEDAFFVDIVDSGTSYGAVVCEVVAESVANGGLLVSFSADCDFRKGV